MKKLAKAIQKLQNQQMIKQALLDPARRKALVNLATLLGGGVGGVGGSLFGAGFGEQLAKSHITPAEVTKEIGTGGNVNNLVGPYVYGGAGTGAVGGAALGGFTARQLAKALLGGDPETNQQTETV